MNAERIYSTLILVTMTKAHASDGRDATAIELHVDKFDVDNSNGQIIQ